MIHQQPPPKPPLLPQHMIFTSLKICPVTETGSDAGVFRRRSRAPYPGGAVPAAPVSGSYYAVRGEAVTARPDASDAGPSIYPSILCKE